MDNDAYEDATLVKVRTLLQNPIFFASFSATDFLIAVSGTGVRKSFALPVGVDRLSILFYFSSYVVRVTSFWHGISIC